MATPLRVLIVEDSTDNVVLVVGELCRSGFEPAYQRVETLEAMREALLNQSWDIVIADYLMPRFSGLAALALVQELCPDLPFILVSGGIGEKVAVAAIKAGAHDYVMRDNLARLGSAVRRELNEAKARQVRRAAADENAKLYRETRRQASKLAALLEIGSDISATLNLSTVLQRIASHAQNLLEADDSDVYLLDPAGEVLTSIVSLGEYAKQIRGAPLKMGEGIVGSIAQSGQAEIVNRADEDPRGIHVPGTPVESHALMCAPLVSRGQVMGAMVVSRTRANGEYDQSDLDFLVSLARQAAIAVENARMYAAELEQRQELVRALEQERKLDRLRNEFIQNVSHELRTPVTIIQGYAELLDAGELGELDQAQKQPIRIITKRAADLRGLIDDLTAILQTRAQQFRKTRVDLADLVQSMTADFQLAAEQESLTLRAQLASDLPPVVGDPDHLRRALDNLVGNAIKFTPAGGAVAVRVTAKAGKVLVEVADTGVGIPGDHLDRIFDRPYQVDGSMSRRYSGTGMGLALAKEIIQAHGGELEVSSEVAKGSIFRVLLPASSES